MLAPLVEKQKYASVLSDDNIGESEICNWFSEFYAGWYQYIKVWGSWYCPLNSYCCFAHFYYREKEDINYFFWFFLMIWLLTMGLNLI